MSEASRHGSERLGVLALEPYYGGSHRAFLDTWCEASRHRFTCLTLPAHKWKWRMRHGALTFARDAARRVAEGERFDVLFATSMVDLAQFRGLVPAALGRLPAVVYFHENQLTYPLQYGERERDLHYGYTHLSTALAADAVWWSSSFHREECLDALETLLRRMPDHPTLEALDEIRARSAVWSPGVQPVPARSERFPGPMRILWASRWEFDKNPKDFFNALRLLEKRGVEFRLNLMGQKFNEMPDDFRRGRDAFAMFIDHWGYQSSWEDYVNVLLASDVVVSTAHHEFFGIAMVEAMAAGCFPVFPERLAYPELLAPVPEARRGDFFYDGSVEHLTDRLEEVAGRLAAGNLWRGDPDLVRRAVEKYQWPRLAPRMDEALAEVASRAGDPEDS